MYVLGISGSPKRGGLTDLLLDKVLGGAKRSGARTEKIILNDLNFKACQECGGCDNSGDCVLNDDMTPLYGKLEKADVVVMASAIFFENITAQLKSMIDRCHSVWVKKYVLKKSISSKKKRKGVFLCVAGRENKEYLEDAKKIIKIFFAIHNIEYVSDIFVPGLNNIALSEPTRKIALEKAFRLGSDLVS